MMMTGIGLLPASGESTVVSLFIDWFVGHPKWTHTKAFVISRFIDSEGCLVTKRLHVVYQDAPVYIRAIIGDVVSYAGEESIINPKTKTMTMRTKNISLSCVASCDELCVYTQAANDHSKTDYRKCIHVQGWLYGFLNSQIENWCVDIDKKNRGNGINVMNEILSSFSSFVLPSQVNV